MSGALPDRRVERTKGAILDAFGALFFANGFNAIDVRQVAMKANVGRSTFYRHFRNKDDLLVQSLAPFFGAIAEACVSEGEPEQLSFICQHFWDNRGLARAVFSGHAMRLMVRSLASEIEQRLNNSPSTVSARFPVTLAAAQLASGQMTMLDEWLRGRGSCSPGEVAVALQRSGLAVVHALLTE